MNAGPFRDDYLVFDRSDVQLAAVKGSVWREAQTTSAPNGEQYTYVGLIENTAAARDAILDRANRLLRRVGTHVMPADIWTEEYRIVDAIPHDTLPHIELFLMVVRHG